jgi:hypothetical protein
MVHDTQRRPGGYDTDTSDDDDACRGNDVTMRVTRANYESSSSDRKEVSARGTVWGLHPLKTVTTVM